MKIASRRIRREYSPMVTNVRISFDKSAAPPTQVYDPEEGGGAFIPDRELTPTSLIPVIEIGSSDGSLSKQDVGTTTPRLTWYVDNKDITTVWNSGTDYTIKDNTLTIYKNIPVDTQNSIYFTASVQDPRSTGTVLEVKSDSIILNTVSLGTDGYTLTLSSPESRKYNPIMDKLFLYDYKTSHGLMAENNDYKKSVTDSGSYIAKFPFKIYKGKTVVTDGYDIKLFDTLDNEIKVGTEGYEDVIEISKKEIIIDLRLITKKSYIIKSYIKETEVARKFITVSREYPKYDIHCNNISDITPNDTVFIDTATVIARGNVIECPESIISILWCTKSSTGKETIHNEGTSTKIDISTTGIDDGYGEWFEIYLKTNLKEKHLVLKDLKDNTTITDSDGSILIFN